MQHSIKHQDVIRLEDMVELPAIDMQADESLIVPALMEMITTVGFLHLTNI